MNDSASLVDQAPYYSKIISFAVLAGAGGAVKFVSASLKSSQMISPRRFLMLLAANIFISGFSGLMGALLFSTLSADHAWQLVSAGVFGYLGTHSLDLIALVMQKKAFGSSAPVSSMVPIPASVDPAAPVAAEKE